MKLLRAVVLLLGALVVVRPPLQAQAQAAERSVVVITLDGFRYQEMFSGADAAYFKRNAKGVIDPVSARYLADTPQARREKLMPFMWSTIASEGQIFGDPASGSRSHVTNGLWFSYPGYNEMFSGAPDPRIDSNNKVPNPNVTVLEWLNNRKGVTGRVAAFGAWDVLPSIVNSERSRIPVGTGFVPVPNAVTAREQEINMLGTDLPTPWGYGTMDAPMVYAAINAITTRSPRVVYLMLGEGDEWAHEKNYALYLDATHRADLFIARIWKTLQSLPQYRGRTTLLITTDHGRGATTTDWSDHGKDVPAAENTWFAAIGPDVPALGVRKNVTVTTSQLAATIAWAIGEDFNAAMPKAASRLPLK